MLLNDSCPAVSQICSCVRPFRDERTGFERTRRAHLDALAVAQVDYPRAELDADLRAVISWRIGARFDGCTVGSESFRNRPSVSWTSIDDLTGISRSPQHDCRAHLPQPVQARIDRDV